MRKRQTRSWIQDRCTRHSVQSQRRRNGSHGQMCILQTAPREGREGRRAEREGTSECSSRKSWDPNCKSLFFMKLTQMFFKLALVVRFQKQRFKIGDAEYQVQKGSMSRVSVKCKGQGCETFAGLGSGPSWLLISQMTFGQLTLNLHLHFFIC